MRNADFLTVSIIVPVLRRDASFKRCLASLEKLQPKPLELMIEFDDEKHPKGPAVVRNRAVLKSKGSLLLFIDADVEVPSDLIARVQKIFEKFPSLSAVFGSYDAAPGDPAFLSQYRNLLHHYVHQNSNEEAYTFWTACGAVKREVFFDLGGFKEGGAGIEDVEFGFRMKEKGFLIRLEKSLQVKHLKKWKTLDLLRTDFFVRALPWTELLLSRPSQFKADLNFKWRDRLLVLLAFLLPLSAFSSSFFGVLLTAFIAVNAPFYSFLVQKRGWGYFVPSVLWQWGFYFLSGFAFSLGFVHYFVLKGQMGLVRRVRVTEAN